MKVVIKNILHINLKRSWNIIPRFFESELQILLKLCKGTLKDWKKPETPTNLKNEAFRIQIIALTLMVMDGWKINLFVYRMNLQSHF